MPWNVFMCLLKQNELHQNASDKLYKAMLLQLLILTSMFNIEFIISPHNI